MATAGLCNTFTIVFRGDDLNTGTGKQITATRPFRIVSIEASNVGAGATLNLNKISGVTVSQFSSANNSAAGLSAVAANARSVVSFLEVGATYATGDILRVLANTGDVKSVTFLCVGEEQALTVTAVP